MWMHRLLVALAFVCLSLAITPKTTDWLYFASEQGNGWDGWVYRVPLHNATTDNVEQLNFTIGVRSMIADNNYVYWGLYNTTWTVARASHDLSDINYEWLLMDGSTCGKGLIYTWAVDTIGNVLWYQGQYGYELCALNLTTMKAKSYGTFAYPGNGGMNGQMQLYRDPESKQVVGILWGIEQGEAAEGEILYMDITNGPSAPRIVVSGLLQFPRAGVMLPGTNTTLVGGYVTAATMYAVDIWSGQVLATYPVGGQPVTAAADPLTSDVYIISPGAASTAGVWMLTAPDYTQKRIIAPDGMCSYCMIYISVVHAPAHPPAPPTPPPPPPPSPPTAPPGTVPYVQWIIPLNGSAAGGYMLYVAGDNFVNSSYLTCRFGRALVPASAYIDSNLIGCVVPPSPIGGEARISVANDGQTFSTEQVYFTYLDDAMRSARRW